MRYYWSSSVLFLGCAASLFKMLQVRHPGGMAHTWRPCLVRISSHPVSSICNRPWKTDTKQDPSLDASFCLENLPSCVLLFLLTGFRDTEAVYPPFAFSGKFWIIAPHMVSTSLTIKNGDFKVLGVFCSANPSWLWPKLFRFHSISKTAKLISSYCC